VTLAEAYRREIELIAHFGRREFGGCLLNLSAAAVADVARRQARERKKSVASQFEFLLCADAVEKLGD
jgi:hypothetical protein